MQIEINWLAVVLAALSTMVVGSVWYSPKVFGTQWQKLVHPGKTKAAQADTSPLRAIIITLVVSFVTAIALAYFAFLTNQFFNNSFLYDSLTAAFWAWLGFTAARFVTHDAFEGRRQRLTLINMAHELVTFLTMGLVIGLLAP